MGGTGQRQRENPVRGEPDAEGLEARTGAMAAPVSYTKSVFRDFSVCEVWHVVLVPCGQAACTAGPASQPCSTLTLGSRHAGKSRN